MPITQTITAIPEAGHRGVDLRDDFVVKQEAFQDALTDTTVDELNTFATEANALAVAATTSETNAANSADDAATSEANASSMVNNKGAWSGLSGALNIPASVTHTNSAWILNVNLADVTASEPTDINTDWTEVSGVTQAELDLKTDQTTFDKKVNQTVVHNITADTDYILTADQNLYGIIEITDTSVLLTIQRNIVLNNTESSFIFTNSTLQDLRVIALSGTGPIVPAGRTVALINNTVNVTDGLIVAHSAYATSTRGGTVKARLSGTILYLTIDGSDA